MYEDAPQCQIKGLDLILMNHFGYHDQGTFVEIGAYDGYNFSNTWGLARADWKGLYVEPIPEHSQACYGNHMNSKNVKVMNCACGSYNGEITMFPSGPISSYSAWFVNSEFWRDRYDHTRAIRVPIFTLDKILEDNFIKPGFELLVIDVEGAELEVLSEFNLKYWEPQMVIIEAQENHPSEEMRVMAAEINEYFSKYKKIYSDEINNIYWKVE